MDFYLSLNVDNLNNVRREASRHFRNKMNLGAILVVGGQSHAPAAAPPPPPRKVPVPMHY